MKKYTRAGFFSFAASFRTSPMVSWPVSARGGEEGEKEEDQSQDISSRHAPWYQKTMEPANRCGCAGRAEEKLLTCRKMSCRIGYTLPGTLLDKILSYIRVNSKPLGYY